MAEINIEDGSTISYRLEGDLSNPTIILLNGSIFNYKQFDPVLLPALKKQLGPGFSYLQYDYVGIANSSELKDTFDFRRIEQQHIQLMDALGIEQAHHFGYSKGSLISLLTAAIHPKRVKTMSGYGNPNLHIKDGMLKEVFTRRRQALSSISGIWDQKIGEYNFEILYDTVFIPIIFPNKTLKTLSIAEKTKNKVIKNKLRPMLEGTKIGVIDKLYKLYTEDTPPEEDEKYVNAMKKISQPVLLLHGEADQTVPIKSSEKLHEWIQNSIYIPIKDFDHTSPALVKKRGGYVMKKVAKFIKNH